MEIESEPIKYEERAFMQVEPQKCCKKNSVKFCRRVARILVDKLTSNKTEFLKDIAEFLSFFQASLENQIFLLSGVIIDPKGLESLHLELIRVIWEKNRCVLSEKQNCRLSLVNFDEWEGMFGFKGFCKRLKKSTKDYDLVLKKITFIDKSSSNVFVGFYSKLLFTLNVLALNMVIFGEMTVDKDIMNLIPEIDNFILMTMEPWLYKFYNHTKAKFATECCVGNKVLCKICRSSLLPADFRERLAQARKRSQAIKMVFERYQIELGFHKEAAIESVIFTIVTYDMWS